MWNDRQRGREDRTNCLQERIRPPASQTGNPSMRGNNTSSYEAKGG